LKNFHLHLVSDSTGETIMAVSRACLVQFENAHAIEHIWSMIRTERQLDKVLDGVKANPGLVLYTLVDTKLRDALEAGCRKLRVPFHAVLDPVLGALSRYLHQAATHLPGRQHALDAEYFGRIEAMDFAMAHDDGQQLANLDKADVVLVGVSRTSKTPTSLYLANRGIRVANVPIVPGVPLPVELDELDHPLIVGLTNDPSSLVHVRLNRLRMLNEKRETTYVDPDAVKAEVVAARRLFSQRGWPVLDVTRRSIEETAAAVLELYNEHRAKRE
jgi:regulator of PEP synthase PpsR (kinase-PPPase family)